MMIIHIMFADDMDFLSSPDHSVNGIHTNAHATFIVAMSGPLIRTKNSNDSGERENWSSVSAFAWQINPSACNGRSNWMFVLNVLSEAAMISAKNGSNNSIIVHSCHFQSNYSSPTTFQFSHTRRLQNDCDWPSNCYKINRNGDQQKQWSRSLHIGQWRCCCKHN